MRMGVIAHELCHVVQIHYGKLSLLKTSFLFLMHFPRRKFERAADKGAIAHGFGQELLEYTNYIRSIPGYIGKRPASTKLSEAIRNKLFDVFDEINVRL